jgi:hypothetical protein
MRAVSRLPCSETSASTLAREGQRRGAADAVRCPGHERDLAGEASFLVRHDPLLFALLV